MPAAVRKVVERIGENCEPALCTVLFMAGAGGCLRAGVTENPVLLTRSVKDLLTSVTCGGAPVYVWPGGGITVMVDVSAHAGERPSATCRRRRSSRRSSSPCAARSTRRSAATSTACAASRTIVARRARIGSSTRWPLNPWPLAGVPGGAPR